MAANKNEGANAANRIGNAISGVVESGRTLVNAFKNPKSLFQSNTQSTIKRSDRGFYFGDSKLAHETFDLDKTSLTGTNPRFAWQYFVQIKINDIQNYPSTTLSKLMADQTNLSPLIKSVEMPGASMTVNKHNAYNRWRVSQTKIEFDPITIKMHDVVNGVALQFWEYYYQYYFLDGSNAAEMSPDDIVPIDYVGNFDYGINAGNGQNSIGKYLIEYIDIFQIHGGRGKRIRIVHPLISKFVQTTHAYDSQEISELSFTFEYEYILYEEGLGPEASLGTVDKTAWETLNDYFSKKRFVDIETDYTPETDSYVSAKDKTKQKKDRTAEGIDQTNLGSAVQGVLGSLRNVAGEVAKVSAVANQFNKFQEDLFGKRIIDIPAPSVRDFTNKISTAQEAYNDISRVSKAVGGVLGRRKDKPRVGVVTPRAGEGTRNAIGKDLDALFEAEDGIF